MTIDVDKVFQEISDLKIELESDPTTLGPKYLNQVIYQCRNYLNKVTQILLEVQREKREVAKKLRAAKTEYDIRSSELLAGDDRVRRLPNIADRQATVRVILSDLARDVTNAEHDLQDLDHVEKAVKLRHNELKHTSADIKAQRMLVRDEYDTGSFYGDEGDTPVGRQRKTDIDEDELDRIMCGTEPTTTPAMQAESIETPPLQESIETPPLQESTESSSTQTGVTEEPSITHVSSEVEGEIKEKVLVTTSTPLPEAPGKGLPTTPEEVEEISKFLDTEGEEAKSKPQEKTQEKNGKAKNSSSKTKSETKAANKTSEAEYPSGEEDIDFSELLKNL